jgi:hypothetical protein
MVGFVNIEQPGTTLAYMTCILNSMVGASSTQRPHRAGRRMGDFIQKRMQTRARAHTAGRRL